MHIKSDVEKQGRSSYFSTRYKNAKEFGSFTDHVDFISFETYGEDRDTARISGAAINAPSLGGEKQAAEIRRALLDSGIALKSKQRDVMTVSAFNEASRDADSASHIEIAVAERDLEQIVAFRLGRWAEERLADSFEIKKASSWKDENKHTLSFRSGETLTVRPDAAPSYTGAVKSGVEHSAYSTPAHKYARSLQAGSKGQVTTRIAADVVTHIPGDNPDIKTALEDLLSRQYDVIKAKVQSELDNGSTLSDAVSVLVTNGFLDLQDGNAIINDQIVNHGAENVAVLDVEPMEKSRLSLFGIKDPVDGEKARGVIQFTHDSAPIQRIAEYNFPSVINGEHHLDLNTVIDVPAGMAKNIAATLSNVESISDVKVSDQNGAVARERIVVKGGVNDVVKTLGQKGLVPQAVADGFVSQFDAAVSAFDNNEPVVSTAAAASLPSDADGHVPVKQPKAPAGP